MPAPSKQKVMQTNYCLTTTKGPQTQRW